jgi:uroporphyrinogen-III synthase
LAGRVVVITRPAGTASGVARQVRARGGVPLLLPGLSLRGTDDAGTRAALVEALRDELLIFTSPAAVRYAACLHPLQTRATVLAVGQGTARALRRHGVDAQAPGRQDSEGVLGHEQLAQPQGKRVALIGAPGGRGVLREQLAARGARLREVQVYRRVAPRLARRHLEAIAQLPATAVVLFSSAEAMENLRAALPPQAWAKLCAATVVVSSERLADIARAAGFERLRVAESALSAHLLDAAAG